MSIKKDIIESLIEVDGPDERTIVDKITLETNINDLRSERARKMIEKSIKMLKSELENRFSKENLNKILDWQKGGKEPKLNTKTRYYSCKNIAVKEAAKNF